MKKLFACLLNLCIILSLVSCNPFSPYITHNTPYYTIVLNSILEYTGDDKDEIRVIETDSQGRVLFNFETWSFYSQYDYLVICQKYDDEMVYYYSEDCFLMKKSKKEFTSEDYDYLKRLNDWDKELDSEKMVSAKIQDTYPPKWEEGRLDSISVIQEYCNYSPKIINVIFDDYGRQLHYLCDFDIKTCEASYYNECLHYSVLFDADGSYDSEEDVLVIEDFEESLSDIRQLKESNNWNKPVNENN